MTIKDIAHAFNFSNAYKGFPIVINGVARAGEADLRRLFAQWLNADHKDIIPEAEMIFEVSLPDGKWLAKIYRKGSNYDYYIPETREQEKRLWAELEAKSNHLKI